MGGGTGKPVRKPSPAGVAGAQEQVKELAVSSVARIAYVSCNPATFARDAEILAKGGYKLDWVQPVGQFRWSTHVELAAAFRR